MIVTDVTLSWLYNIYLKAREILNELSNSCPSINSS